MKFINWNKDTGVFKFGQKYLNFEIKYKIKRDLVAWLSNDQGLNQMCTSPGKAKEFAEEDLRERLIKYYKEQLLNYKEIVDVPYDKIYHIVFLIPVRRWVRIGNIKNEESAKIQYKIGDVIVNTTVEQVSQCHWIMTIRDKDGEQLYQWHYLSFRAAKRSGIKYTRQYMVDEIGKCIVEMNSLADTISHTDKGWGESDGYCKQD